jgi:hypothetical protein
LREEWRAFYQGARSEFFINRTLNFEL